MPTDWPVLRLVASRRDGKGHTVLVRGPGARCGASVPGWEANYALSWNPAGGGRKRTSVVDSAVRERGRSCIDKDELALSRRRMGRPTLMVGGYAASERGLTRWRC